jgi:hypothetical protein
MRTELKLGAAAARAVVVRMVTALVPVGADKEKVG